MELAKKNNEPDSSGADEAEEDCAASNVLYFFRDRMTFSRNSVDGFFNRCVE